MTETPKASGASRRQILTAGAAGALAAPLLALSGGWALAADDEAALLAGAKKEGRGVVYSNADPGALDQALKAFTAKYGLQADVQRLTGAALAQRFSAEYSANTHLADFFISSDPLFPKDAIKKGWLLRPDDLPAMAYWPKSDTVDGLVSLGLNPYTLCWNTDVVPETLTSWEALNDPKYRGKVMVGDPRVLASARNWYVAIRGKYGDDFIKMLGSHASFSPSAVPGMQQLGAGAVGIYAPTTYLNAEDMIGKGAPIKSVLVDPIVVSVPWGAVVAKAPHPNFGKLLLNFIMSREGQAAYDKGGFSLLADVPGTKTLSNAAKIDAAEGDRQLPEILAMLKLG